MTDPISNGAYHVVPLVGSPGGDLGADEQRRADRRPPSTWRSPFQRSDSWVTGAMPARASALALVMVPGGDLLTFLGAGGIDGEFGCEFQAKIRKSRSAKSMPYNG
ncbi:hypothetical protein [Methylosinus sp. R-45379]|uniref:hypothetical protein n=1 Tax=Methylosinus sp. R-45379 TaxID=980563 RepID=UPI000A6B8238|nr:hypothetical protein [Methylosinus sp. R-45379]